MANRDQAERWNTGSDVDHWVNEQGRHDEMLFPFIEILMSAAALRPNDNVLDIGCGCGATTLAAARIVRHGTALGVDLSGPMLTRARAGADTAGLDNVTFEQADVQTTSFGATRFDAVISRFGVMFFDDPVAAFANAHGAMKPEGRLAFVCWQPRAANEWLRVIDTAFGEVVPLPTSAQSVAPACSRSPTHSRSRVSWRPQGGLRPTAPTPTSRCMSEAEEASMTPSTSFAAARWDGRSSLESIPKRRLVRWLRSEPRSRRITTETGFAWTSPCGS